MCEKKRKPRMRLHEDRDLSIVESVKIGESYAEIGRKHNLTRQRVEQIAKRFGLRSTFALASRARALDDLPLKLAEISMLPDSSMQQSAICSKIGIKKGSTLFRAIFASEEVKERIEKQKKEAEQINSEISKLRSQGLTFKEIAEAVFGDVRKWNKVQSRLSYSGQVTKNDDLKARKKRIVERAKTEKASVIAASEGVKVTTVYAYVNQARNAEFSKIKKGEYFMIRDGNRPFKCLSLAYMSGGVVMVKYLNSDFNVAIVNRRQCKAVKK